MLCAPLIYNSAQSCPFLRQLAIMRPGMPQLLLLAASVPCLLIRTYSISSILAEARMQRIDIVIWLTDPPTFSFGPKGHIKSNMTQGASLGHAGGPRGAGGDSNSLLGTRHDLRQGPVKPMVLPSLSIHARGEVTVLAR